MPTILLSLISSGALKWISILVLVFGLVGGMYSKHRQIVDQEKQIALQQYNINQLEQTIKDRDRYIGEVEDLYRTRSERINELLLENKELEKKLEAVNTQIDKHVGAGRDKESSQILKDTIKSLGEMK
jgi:septal ring factor EnvC (AmiA/AmiB activator)